MTLSKLITRLSLIRFLECPCLYQRDVRSFLASFGRAYSKRYTPLSTLSVLHTHILSVAEASEDDVNTAVAAAEAAFPAWSALSPTERGLPLKKMAEKILASKDELASLDAISMGRPVDGYFDANYAGVHFNYFGEAAYAQGKTSLNTPGFLNMSLRQPFGVVAIIIPWNAPLVFFSKKVAPAVAAGNTVVLKSSEKAPLTVSYSLAFNDQLLTKSSHGKSPNGSKNAVFPQAS